MAQRTATRRLDGERLREMLSAATLWLEKSAAEIDALNVFPVPDGDTGSNMLLTMKATVREAYEVREGGLARIAGAVGHGALKGARGNSGVILSQILMGLTGGLAESSAQEREIDGSALAGAMRKAADLAYQAIENPTEGTILTVVRDAAVAAEKTVSQGKNDFLAVLQAAVSAARRSVARTPGLLPVLREAGVVDAGGQGLYTILQGGLRYLRGEAGALENARPEIIGSTTPELSAVCHEQSEEGPYGYCTQVLLSGSHLDQERIRAGLRRRGHSLMVVGNDSSVRIHIHTLKPEEIIRYATSVGTLAEVNVKNMDQQCQEHLEALGRKRPTVDSTGVVAVAAGKGMTDVLTGMGATIVVPGGQTMNPSVRDLLQALDGVAAKEIIVLPNNKNVILTARQAQTLSDKKVAVVPSRTVPQGITALAALDYQAGFERNVELATAALSRVRTIEITRAVRSSQIHGLEINRGDLIGLLDGNLLLTGVDETDVLDRILGEIQPEQGRVVTIYYGEGVDVGQAEQLRAAMGRQHPRSRFELIDGGQPHYSYIVSIE